MFQKITSREELVREIAEALQSNYDESQSYLNLTTQEVGMHTNPAIVGEDCKWPHVGDEVLGIEPLPSRESFQSLVEFAEEQPENIAEKLFRALNGNRPFARFKVAVETLDLLDKWYVFKNEWYEWKAERWLHFENVDFKDGKVVSKAKPHVWDMKDDKSYV